MADLRGPIEGQALIYATADGAVRVGVLFGDETFWLTLNRMAELFGTSKQAISCHLKQIYESAELSRAAKRLAAQTQPKPTPFDEA